MGVSDGRRDEAGGVDGWHGDCVGWRTAVSGSFADVAITGLERAQDGGRGRGCGVAWARFGGEAVSNVSRMEDKGRCRHLLPEDCHEGEEEECQHLEHLVCRVIYGQREVFVNWSLICRQRSIG